MAIKTNLEKERRPRNGIYPLPSCGLLYGEEFPRQFEAIPFGFEVEDILTQEGKGLFKLAKIARSIVTNFPEDFPCESLLVGDLYAILACGRALTYGENYKFRAKCPECGHSELITIRVPEDVPVQTWDRFKDREELEKALRVKLTNAKDDIRFKFLTVREELDLSDFKRVNKTSGGVDSRRTHSIASQIVSVNGGIPDNLTEASAYVRMLRGTDMTELADKIEEMDCGIDMTYNIECDKCHAQYEHSIPLHEDFFRRNRF